MVIVCVVTSFLVLHSTTCGYVCVYLQVGQSNTMKEPIQTLSSATYLTSFLVLHSTTCGYVCVYLQVGQSNTMKEHIQTLSSATLFP